jgi:hypothetical protein
MRPLALRSAYRPAICFRDLSEPRIDGPNLCPEEKIVLQDGMYSRTKLPSRNWNRDHGDDIAFLMTVQVQLFRARSSEVLCMCTDCAGIGLLDQHEGGC